LNHSPIATEAHSKISLAASITPTAKALNGHLDRVTEMTRASFACRLPESLKSEIFEYPDGRFDFRAEYIDRHAAKPQRPALYDFDHKVRFEPFRVQLGVNKVLTDGMSYL
jgi:hypothetical protein